MIFKHSILCLLLYICMTSYFLINTGEANCNPYETSPAIVKKFTPNDNTIENAQPLHHQAAFNDCIDAFTLLTKLFYDTTKLHDYAIPEHAPTRALGKDFLSAGFSAEMADNIFDTYLLWVPKIERFIVIPTDSIPLITDADKNMITIKDIDLINIQMQRIYDNCYERDDQYLYTIMLNKNLQSDRWIISELRLIKIK